MSLIEKGAFLFLFGFMVLLILSEMIHRHKLRKRDQQEKEEYRRKVLKDMTRSGPAVIEKGLEDIPEEWRKK